MTSKVGKRPLRSLSAHEKMEAIRRVHDGESKASVARDIGVPESTLRGWCKNEDKILYLSRQSTPDTDDSDHLQPPREKKPRYDDILQPYNLSVRGASNSPPPPPATVAVVEPATVDTTEVEVPLPAALNLTNKQDSPKTAAGMITPTSTISAADRERERNRAELARLSVELGLNRPEMFMPNANLAANLSDLSTLTANLGLVAQWNSALLQQVTASANTATSNTKKRTTSSAALADTTNQLNSVPPVVTTAVPTTTSATHHHNNNNNNNNNNIHKTNQKVKKSSHQHVDSSSVDDSVWYWLKTQQAMLGLVQNQGQNSVDPNSSWFWKWYKQLAYSQHFPQNVPQPQVNTTTTTTTPEKPILYQQLTKDSNLENQVKNEETPKSTKTNTKVRAVLDNLLLNNNNNDDDPTPINNGVDDVTKDEKPEDSTPISAAEALSHGELFLKWLEKCGDPSVTAVQILQFRYLLNNVRTGADRKNGAENMKTKVRSRK